MSEFTAEQKLECLRREIRLRRKVYPGRVIQGTMSQEKADYEIAVMEAIADEYEQPAAKERLL